MHNQAKIAYTEIAIEHAPKQVRRDIQSLIHPRTAVVKGWHIRMKGTTCTAIGPRFRRKNMGAEICHAISDFARLHHRQIPKNYRLFAVV